MPPYPVAIMTARRALFFRVHRLRLVWLSDAYGLARRRGTTTGDSRIGDCLVESCRRARRSRRLGSSRFLVGLDPTRFPPGTEGEGTLYWVRRGEREGLCLVWRRGVIRPGGLYFRRLPPEPPLLDLGI